jgi:hypothetical protein
MSFLAGARLHDEAWPVPAGGCQPKPRSFGPGVDLEYRRSTKVHRTAERRRTEMSKARAIVSFPSGRRGKWVVLILWILILAVAGSLAGKLTGAEKNDAQSWLPP